jgi:hypothetical protein
MSAAFLMYMGIGIGIGLAISGLAYWLIKTFMPTSLPIQVHQPDPTYANLDAVDNRIIHIPTPTPYNSPALHPAVPENVQVDGPEKIKFAV